MSSVARYREFVNERLHAAAEEIFEVFKKAVSEYEEEIIRQRRLLDMILKPQIKLQKTDFVQSSVCIEEDLHDHQQRFSSLNREESESPPNGEEQHQEDFLQSSVCKEGYLHDHQQKYFNQESCSMLDHDEPESPQNQASQLEHYNNGEGEQLVLKLENDSINLDPFCEENNESENQFLTPDMMIKSESDRGMPGASEPNHDQLLSPVADIMDHQLDHQLANGKPVRCRHCAEEFSDFMKLRIHKRTHMGEEQHAWQRCDEEASGRTRGSSLTVTQTDAKPSYAVHMKTHTAERPHTCVTCGRSFCHRRNLTRHNIVHRRKKPYSCKYCEKKFCYPSTYINHVLLHTAEFRNVLI
ncbi:zinc finger protein 436-like isoform X2 [Thalassophryne amazonica]|uniref:zinc finger protein 436-like isoform X2 n=1 Tax=Thalassophryne amazonica TaxID=390379 RepID=UPI001471ECD4|nr:zinc finger protein 436-like isoform X2 [Thalassophryne amazonica]